MNSASFKLRKVCKSAALGVAIVLLASVETAASASLRQAVSQAIASSSAQKAAIESIEAQGGAVGIAQGERGVSVRLFGRAAAERIDDPSSLGSLQDPEWRFARQIGIEAEYPLLDGMRSLNTVFREATLLDAEIIRLSDETETIALNAVQAYINVVRHRQVVRLAARNVNVHARIRGQVETQVSAGRLSSTDSFRASEKLLEARLARTEAQSALAEAISNYQLVIGQSPSDALTMPGSPPLPRSSSELERAAVANSFQLHLAQKEIDAQDYQERIDDADWQPSLDLYAGGDVGSNLDGTDENESALRAGVRLNWTLYKGGTREKTIARNRDLRMRSVYRKKQVEDEVRDFARRAWISFMTAAERRAILGPSVTTGEQLAQAYREEFEAAKRPLLQVLEAERDLFNLRVRLVNADAAAAFQSYRLLAAQSTLASHFGLSHAGRALVPNYEARVRAAPRASFDVSTPDLQ